MFSQFVQKIYFQLNHVDALICLFINQMYYFSKKINKFVLNKIVWLKNMFLINKISENYCFDRNFLQQ
jgi:hypothetical protein